MRIFSRSCRSVLCRALIGVILGTLSALPWAIASAAPRAVATIPLSDPVRWDYVSVDSQAHRLYVAHRERVDVIDTRSDKSILQLSPTPGVHGAPPAPELHRVFTSDGADDTVGVFDADTGKLIQTSRSAKGLTRSCMSRSRNASSRSTVTRRTSPRSTHDR